MAEFLPINLKTSSAVSKLDSVTRSIVTTSQNKSVLTIEGLRDVTAGVVTLHGLKDVPDQITMALCFKAWEDKFSFRMNKQELTLAFEMNVRGDFTIERNGKIEHSINIFQCFTVEFFCSVLNQYLTEKDTAVKKVRALEKREEQNAPLTKQPDLTIDIFEAIVDDYKAYHLGGYVYTSPDKQFPTHNKFPTNSKFTLLGEIYDMDISERNVIKLREVAQRILLRELQRKKQTLPKINEAHGGAELSLVHQIARIKAGKLINKEDEDLIQIHVKRLLYLQLIDAYKLHDGQIIDDNEFVKHVKENMEIYKQINYQK